MRFPIVIEQGDDGIAFGVVVPDIQGCFSAGDSLDEAINNAKEAIEFHLEALLHDNAPLPQPSAIEVLRRNQNFQGWLWAVVEVDLSKVKSTTKRYNITMPECVMAMVDVAACQTGESRSSFLAKAAMERIEKSMHTTLE